MLVDTDRDPDPSIVHRQVMEPVRGVWLHRSARRDEYAGLGIVTLSMLWVYISDRLIHAQSHRQYDSDGMVASAHIHTQAFAMHPGSPRVPWSHPMQGVGWRFPVNELPTTPTPSPVRLWWSCIHTQTTHVRLHMIYYAARRVLCVGALTYYARRATLM